MAFILGLIIQFMRGAFQIVITTGFFNILDFTMFTDLVSLSVFLGSWKFFYWIFDIKWTTAVSSSQVNGHLVVCKKMPLPGNLCS